MKTKSTFHVAIALLVILGLSSGCSRSPIARKMQFMEAGRRYYDQKDYPRAILQFKNAVGAANGDPEPDYWLGLAYLGAGNIPLAIAEFKKAVALNPKHAAAQLRIGELLALSNDPDLLKDALARLHSALNGAVSANALSAIALTELKLGKTDEAHQHLEESLDQFPQELSAYVILAKTNILKGDNLGAEAVLKRAVQASPQSSSPLIALGDFYVLMRNEIEAEKLFRQAIALDKKNAVASFELAMLEYRTGRKSEAEPLFRELSTLPDPRYLPLHAIYLYKEGKKQEAVAELEQLVRAHPKSPELRTQLLAAYWVTNRLGDVERVLNATLKENPKDFGALLQRGELYVAMGKYAPAQVDLDKALGFRQDSAAAHYIMAKLSQARGADLAYRKELSEAIRFAPDLLQARLELAAYLTDHSGASAAVKILDEAPAFQKRTLLLRTQRNWALLGMNNLPEFRQSIKEGLAVARTPELLIQNTLLNLADRNFAAAKASIEEALQKAPSDSRALNALAAVYTADKRTGDLGKRLRQYAQDNKSADVQMFVGNWFMSNGDRQEARAFFRSAKLADPSFHDADLALVVLDMEDGKTEAARSAINDLMKIRDQDVNLRRRSAVLETAAGNVPQAIAEYRQILTIDQNDFFALNNLAYLLANSNHPDEALAYAQHAKELQPTLPQVEDTLGWVLLNKAIYGEAMSHLQLAAQKRPNDPVIQYHLGLAYWRSGDRTRGAQVLQAALKAAPNIPEAVMARHEMSDGGK